MRKTAEAKQIEAQPLQLTIKSDKQVYEVGEEIILTATLKNNIDKEMIIFWGNQKPTIRSDEAGVYIVGMYVKSDNETLYIKPKESITKTVGITLDKRMKPIQGKIGIQFLYSNTGLMLGYKHRPDQDIWMGSFISNTITIEVVEKKGRISEKEALEIAKEKLQREPFANDIDAKKVTVKFREQSDDYWVDFSRKECGERRPGLWNAGYYVVIDINTGDVKEATVYKR